MDLIWKLQASISSPIPNWSHICPSSNKTCQSREKEHKQLLKTQIKSKTKFLPGKNCPSVNPQSKKQRKAVGKARLSISSPASLLVFSELFWKGLFYILHSGPDGASPMMTAGKTRKSAHGWTRQPGTSWKLTLSLLLLPGPRKKWFVRNCARPFVCRFIAGGEVDVRALKRCLTHWRGVGEEWGAERNTPGARSAR